MSPSANADLLDSLILGKSTPSVFQRGSEAFLRGLTLRAIGAVPQPHCEDEWHSLIRLGRNRTFNFDAFSVGSRPYPELRQRLMVDDEFFATKGTFAKNQELGTRCKSAATLWRNWRAPRRNAPGTAEAAWA